MRGRGHNPGLLLSVEHPSGSARPWHLARQNPLHLPGRQVRATDGRRKLSTVVKGADLAKFQESFTTIMRVSKGVG